MLRKKLNTDRLNPNVAAAYAESALGIYRKTGDVKYFTYAKGAIHHWMDESEPPQKIWLLRGRILQSDHYFTAAAKDLSDFVNVHGHNPEALLLMADAWRRAGEIDQARRACFMLGISGHQIIAQYCAIEIMLSLGEYLPAFIKIQKLSKQLEFLPINLQQWALVISAETSHIAGYKNAATNYYSRAFALNNENHVLRVHYAENMIQNRQFKSAHTLLQNNNKSIAASLRLAMLAKAQEDQKQLSQLTNSLAQEFSNPLLAEGDFLTEKAMFNYYILQDYSAAQALAVRNWKNQKSWEDSELVVLASSKNRNDTKILTEIRAWRERWNRTEKLTVELTQ